MVFLAASVLMLGLTGGTVPQDKSEWILGQFDRETGLWVPGHYSNESVALPEDPDEVEKWINLYGFMQSDGKVYAAEKNMEYQYDEKSGKHKRGGNMLKIRPGMFKFTKRTLTNIGGAALLGLAAMAAAADPEGFQKGFRKGMNGGVDPEEKKPGAYPKLSPDRDAQLRRWSLANAIVVSGDGHYLGCFNRTTDYYTWLGNAQSPKSRTDLYGSMYSSFGPYGPAGQSSWSAYNENANEPPRIVVIDENGRPKVVGYITRNTRRFHHNAYDPDAIRQWIAGN